MTKLPVEYLLVCSGKSLEDFELNRLNHVANLRKQMRPIEDQLHQAELEAVLASWLREHREDLLAAGAAKVVQKSFEFHTRPALPVGSLPARVSRSGKKRVGKKQENVA